MCSGSCYWLWCHTHTHTHRSVLIDSQECACVRVVRKPMMGAIYNKKFLGSCDVNVGWRERNQQDATNLMFIIKLLSEHVSGIIMPIIRRTRRCITAYGVLHWLCWLWLCGAGSQAVCTVWKPNSNLHTVHTACDPAPHNHSQHNQCRTPYAVIHGLVLLMMGIMMPKTCWDRSLIINIWLVASCWFLSLHPITKNVSNSALLLVGWSWIMDVWATLKFVSITMLTEERIVQWNPDCSLIHFFFHIP